MSLITDVVVVAMSDEREAMAYVNKHLMADDPRGQQFAPLDMSAAGGGKVASSAVYAAAFNFVDITGLEDALRSAPWRFPDWVTVCILGETTGFERLFPGSEAQTAGYGSATAGAPAEGVTQTVAMPPPSHRM